MSKAPEDRYKTVAELSADLQRHLDDEPIHAKPPSTWERARKWARRHRSIVRTAAATLMLAIGVAGVLLARQYQIALDARAIAELQRDAAKYDAYECHLGGNQIRRERQSNS